MFSFYFIFNFFSVFLFPFAMKQVQVKLRNFLTLQIINYKVGLLPCDNASKHCSMLLILYLKSLVLSTLQINSMTFVITSKQLF